MTIRTREELDQIMAEAQEAASKAAEAKLEEMRANGPQVAFYSADLAGNRLHPKSEDTLAYDLCGGASLSMAGRGKLISAIKKFWHHNGWSGCNSRYSQNEDDTWTITCSKGIYKGYRISMRTRLSGRQEVGIHEAAMKAAAEVLNQYQSVWVRTYLS